MQTVDTHELAWAAGFFDGEGSISTILPLLDTKQCVRVLLGLSQVRPEPLYRFKEAVGGIGNLKGPYLNARGGQPFYRYQAGTHRQVQHVVALLWNFLSEPKREQCFREMRRYLDARSAPQRQYRGVEFGLVHVGTLPQEEMA